MSKPGQNYCLVAVKTSLRTRGGDVSKNRAQPLPNQGFDTDCNVEFSRSVRDKYPTGTVFLIWAKLTDREGGTPFLYSHHSWDFLPISERLANKLISEGKIGKRSLYAAPKEIKTLGIDPE